MDYEEKYMNALETIQEILNSGADSIKMSRLKLRLQPVFPELRESEDERVQKTLIDYFDDVKKVGVRCNGLHPDVILTWLKKQGEQKSQRMISAEAKEALYNKPTWSEEDGEMMDRIISDIEGLKERTEFPINIEAYDDEIDWLKSLKERMKGE